MALLDGKGKDIAAAIGTIYPKVQDVFGFKPGEMPSSEDVEMRPLDVLSEAQKLT